MGVVIKIGAMAAAFAGGVFLMFTRRLPAMLALPALAIALALIVDVPWESLSAHGTGGTAYGAWTIIRNASGVLETVLATGALRLHSAAFTFLFGSVFAAFLDRAGIARDIIRITAELSGERPRLTAAVLLGAVSLLFTTLSGLGAIVMVGTIVLPLLTALAIAPDRAGALLLIGISVGGILNPANWRLYEDVLGLPRHDILMFALPFSVLAALVGIVFIVREIAPAPDDVEGPVLIEVPPSGAPPAPTRLVGREAVAMGVPLVPLLLIAVMGMDPIAAFVVALLIGTILRPGHRGSDRLVASVLEGITQAGPAIAIVTGLGMLIVALEMKAPGASQSAVARLIGPGLAALVPHGRLAYVAVFALASPLALYRGPLNIWGMGMGLAGLLATTGALSPILLAAALLSVGQIQGIGDPTNTHNVWIAGFTGVSTRRLLVLTFPYALAMATAGLTLAALVYGQ